MRAIQLGAVLSIAVIAAACGGGKSAAPAPGGAGANATKRKPDASISLTITPTKVNRGTKTAKRRAPKFIDYVEGGNIQLEFDTYGEPQTNYGPTPIDGTIEVTVPVYSGPGNSYGQEYDANGNLLAVTNYTLGGTYYDLDPGTDEQLAMTLWLEPADIFLTTDPALGNAYDANSFCINVGAQSGVNSQLFTLVPGDADDDYAPQAPATSASYPPNPANPAYLSSAVTLSNITPSTDAGGTSTIVATPTTWNGYPVYKFVYMPTATPDQFAPSVTANATTADPNNYQGTFQQQLTINPANCDD
jgi:YD repeat-containing protein